MLGGHSRFARDSHFDHCFPDRYNKSNPEPQFFVWRSVLQPASYYTGIVQQLKTMGVYNSEVVVVEPLVLAALARQALGGSNENLVTYSADTAPTTTVKSGTALSFTVTVRNDGWAAISADCKLCAGLAPSAAAAFTPSVCTSVGNQGIAEGGSWVATISGLQVSVPAGQSASLRFGMWTAEGNSFQQWGSADITYKVLVV